MNWYNELDYFYPLEADAERMFGTPREAVLAIQSYNRILYSIMEGEREKALEPLQQICSDFPLFAEARHLYAIMLAGQGRSEEALKILKQAALLELDAQNSERLKFQLKELELEVKKTRLLAERQKRREASLSKVKADLAKGSILQKAGSNSRNPGFASPEERRSIEAGGLSKSGQPAPIYFDDPDADRQKTIRFALVVSLIAVLIFLFFYTFIRPKIIASNRSEVGRRLDWLEHELAERRSDSKDIEDLAEAYAEFIKDQTD